MHGAMSRGWWKALRFECHLFALRIKMTNTQGDFPLDRGMRLRGLAMTRLETFVDAAFAFAVTLLVISVDDVPRSFEEFILALKSIPVFLGASAQVFLFWIAHRNWSRVYGLDDRVAVVLTLLLVASLLVMVFPLRIVYGFAVFDMTGGWILPPFELDLVRGPDQLRLIFIVLGVSWAWLSGVIVTMFGYALRQDASFELNEAERANATRYIRIFAVLGLSGLTSITIAATAPADLVDLAGYQYFLLFIAIPLAIRRPRVKPAHQPAAHAEDQ